MRLIESWVLSHRWIRLSGARKLELFVQVMKFHSKSLHIKLNRELFLDVCTKRPGCTLFPLTHNPAFVVICMLHNYIFGHTDFVWNPTACWTLLTEWNAYISTEIWVCLFAVVYAGSWEMRYMCELISPVEWNCPETPWNVQQLGHWNILPSKCMLKTDVLYFLTSAGISPVIAWHHFPALLVILRTSHDLSSSVYFKQ